MHLQNPNTNTTSMSFCLYLGDKLCSAEDCIPGTGVYLRHGYIYSSLAGYVLRKNEGEEVRGVGKAGEGKVCSAVRQVQMPD